MTKLDENLLYQIYAVVLEIPRGKVATYGQVAKLSGHDKHARLVGKALSHAECYGDYPCHRVVNHQGRLAPNFINQRELLEAENVIFKANGHVDLKKCQWKTM